MIYVYTSASYTHGHKGDAWNINNLKIRKKNIKKG